MKALIVAKREFLGTRNLWIFALAMGLFALLGPWIRGLRDQPPADFKLVGVLTLSLGMSVALGLVLGAAMFGGEQPQRRMGFFLARPIGTGSLYAGKLLGTLAVAAAASILVLLPYALLHPGEMAGAWALPVGLLVAGLAAILVGHVASIMFRARSPWLILDMLAIGGFEALVWFALGALGDARAYQALLLTIGLLAAWTLLVLLAAGYAQVAKGRADLRLGHRAMSMTLACGLLAGGGVAWACAWMVVRP